MNSNAWRVMDEAPDRSDRLHTDSFNFALVIGSVNHLHGRYSDI